MTAPFLFPPTARVEVAYRQATHSTNTLIRLSEILNGYNYWNYARFDFDFFFHTMAEDRSSPDIPREPPLETDLYDILGVSQDASPETIRSAYKKQALKNHPGTCPCQLSMNWMEGELNMLQTRPPPTPKTKPTTNSSKSPLPTPSYRTSAVANDLT